MNIDEIRVTVDWNKKRAWRSPYEGLNEFEIEAYLDETGLPALPEPSAVFAMSVDELVAWVESHIEKLEIVLANEPAQGEAREDFNEAMRAQESYLRIAHNRQGWELRLCYGAFVGLRGFDLKLAAFGDEAQ